MVDGTTGLLRSGEADPLTEARVADAFVDTLRSYGVQVVFGIPGGAISPIYDACLDQGVEVVCNQHESSAVFCAAGYARATGGLGVVAVTSGPGILNALTGSAAANLDEIP